MHTASYLLSTVFLLYLATQSAQARIPAAAKKNLSITSVQGLSNETQNFPLRTPRRVTKCKCIALLEFGRVEVLVPQVNW